MGSCGVHAVEIRGPLRLSALQNRQQRVVLLGLRLAAASEVSEAPRTRNDEGGSNPPRRFARRLAVWRAIPKELHAGEDRGNATHRSS